MCFGPKSEEKKYCSQWQMNKLFLRRNFGNSAACTSVPDSSPLKSDLCRFADHVQLILPSFRLLHDLSSLMCGMIDAKSPVVPQWPSWLRYWRWWYYLLENHFTGNNFFFFKFSIFDALKQQSTIEFYCKQWLPFQQLDWPPQDCSLPLVFVCLVLCMSTFTSVIHHNN